MCQVNGRTLEECLKVLSSKKEPDKKLQGKYPYYKIESYYERMQEAFGSHYSEEYDDYRESVIKNGQEHTSVKCTISILDDEYRCVKKVCCYSGVEIQYVNETGLCAGLKNIPKCTCIAAFKAACDEMGIFGKRPADDDKTPAADKSSSDSKDSKSDKKELPSESYKLHTMDRTPTTVRKDSKTGLPVYKYRCSDESGSAVDVIFYPNNYSRITDMFNQFISMATQKSVNFTCSAKKSADIDGVGQLIFTGFEGNS